MLTSDSYQQAVEFARWKPDDNVDQTMKCEKCNRYYDYRIFLIHKCMPVVKTDLGYIPTV